jgi:hypothetical protein
MVPSTLQYSPLLVAEPVSETSVADTTVAPVVGNPIELAGTVIPANALHFAAGATTAAFAGVVSLPPQPDTVTADAANRALTIAELRRKLNRVLILVSIYFLLPQCAARRGQFFSSRR